MLQPTRIRLADFSVWRNVIQKLKRLPTLTDHLDSISTLCARGRVLIKHLFNDIEVTGVERLLAIFMSRATQLSTLADLHVLALEVLCGDA